MGWGETIILSFLPQSKGVVMKIQCPYPHKEKQKKSRQNQMKRGYSHQIWQSPLVFMGENYSFAFLSQLETMENRHLLLFTSYKSLALICHLVIWNGCRGNRYACNLPGCFQNLFVV